MRFYIFLKGQSCVHSANACLFISVKCQLLCGINVSVFQSGCWNIIRAIYWAYL